MSHSNNAQLAKDIQDYLDDPDNQKPKTLHGIEISVDSWQAASVFGQADPNILPVDFPANFIDKETGRPLATDDYPTEETTPSNSSDSSSESVLIVLIKNKGKKKEVEDTHDDPLSDDIYDEESEKKPYVPSSKLQELMKTMEMTENSAKPKLMINTSPIQGKGQGGSATRVVNSPQKKVNVQKEETRTGTESRTNPSSLQRQPASRRSKESSKKQEMPIRRTATPRALRRRRTHLVQRRQNPQAPSSLLNPNGCSTTTASSKTLMLTKTADASYERTKTTTRSIED